MCARVSRVQRGAQKRGPGGRHRSGDFGISIVTKPCVRISIRESAKVEEDLKQNSQEHVEDEEIAFLNKNGKTRATKR